MLQESVESFTVQQKVLMHSKKLYCASKSYTMQQKVLLYRRKLYCVAESFTALQKVLLHSRKFYCAVEGFIAQQIAQQKSRPCAGEKFILRQKQRISLLCSVFPWTLDSMFAYKLTVTKWYFGAHSAKRWAQLPSQKKPKLSVVQQHQDARLRYKKLKKNP